MDIFKALLEECPIKYELIYEENGAWGNVTNGTITGLLGRVSQGNVASVLVCTDKISPAFYRTSSLWGRPFSRIISSLKNKTRYTAELSPDVGQGQGQ